MMPTTRSSWVLVTLILSTAVLALCWALLERQARIRVERELARALRPDRVRAVTGAVPSAAATPPSHRPGPAGPDAQPGRSGPAAGGDPQQRVSPPAGAPAPTAAPDPAPAAPEDPAAAANPAADALTVDLARPAAEFDRILPLLRERVAWPGTEREPKDRELLAQTLVKLLAAAPGEIRPKILAALRAERHWGLFQYLLEFVVADAPETAAQVVRESLGSDDAALRSNAASVLHVLPAAEAEGHWRTLLADRDPSVRQTAVSYPPGDEPRFDAGIRDATLRETNPKDRGDMVFTLFAARSTAENLALLVQELRRNEDGEFRAATLRWLGPYLTPRDLEAVQLLRDLGGRQDIDPAVRRLALETLVKGGPGPDGLVRPGERAEWRRILAELK